MKRCEACETIAIWLYQVGVFGLHDIKHLQKLMKKKKKVKKK